MTGCPSSASRAAWWLNGISASLGISPLVLAEQQRRRGELHAVLAHGLQAGIRRARPGEQRDVGRLGLAPQAHHPGHVGAVKVRVHQAGPLPLGGQRQCQVHRDRGLAHAALPARHRDDWHVIRTARHDCSWVWATLAMLASGLISSYAL
jgi:hypothetical protein